MVLLSIFSSDSKDLNSTVSLLIRQVVEGPDAPSEEALCGGGREAEGAAHAGLPQLQVPASPEEAAETHLQARGPRVPLERAGS